MSSTRHQREADSITGMLTEINNKIWRFIDEKMQDVYFKKEAIKEDIDNLIQNNSIIDAEFGVEIRNYLNELYLAHLFLFRLVGQHLPDNTKVPVSTARALILAKSVIKLDARFTSRIINRHMDTLEFTNSREHFYLQSLVLKFFSITDLADQLTRIFSVDAEGKLVNPKLEDLNRFLLTPNLVLEKIRQYNNELGNIILLMNTKKNKELNFITSAAVFYRDFYFDNNMVSFIKKNHFDYLIKLDVTSETVNDEIRASAKEVFEAILLSEIYILEFFRYAHQGFMAGNDIPMPELATEIASCLLVKPKYALLGQNDITEGDIPLPKARATDDETPEMKAQLKTVSAYIDFARMRKAVRHVEDDLDLRPAIKTVIKTMKASIYGIHCVSYILECIEKRQSPSLAAVLMNQNNRALSVLGNLGTKPLTPAASPTAALQGKKISRPNTPKLTSASSPAQSPKTAAASPKTSAFSETKDSDIKEHFSKTAYLHLYSTMKNKLVNLDAKEKEYAALYTAVKSKLANCTNRKKHIEQVEQTNNNFKEKMLTLIKALRARISVLPDCRSSDKAHTDLQELTDTLTQTLHDFEKYYIDRLLAIRGTLTMTATIVVPGKNAIQLEKERKAAERLSAIAAKKEKKAAARLRRQVEMENGMTNPRRISDESKSPESTSRNLSDGSPLLDWEEYAISPGLSSLPGILMVPPMMRRNTSSSSGESLDLPKLNDISSSTEETRDSLKVSISPLILPDNSLEIVVNIERLVSPGVEDEISSSPMTDSSPEPQEVFGNDIIRKKSPDLVKANINPLSHADNNLEMVFNKESLTPPNVEKEVSLSPETGSTPEPQELSDNDIIRGKSPNLVKVNINPLIHADSSLEMVVNIESITAPGAEKVVSSPPETGRTPEPQEVSDNDIIEEKSPDLVKVSINPSTDNSASLPVIVKIENLIAEEIATLASDKISTSASTESPEDVTAIEIIPPAAKDEQPKAQISRRENFTLTLSSLSVEEDDDPTIQIIPNNFTSTKTALSLSATVIAVSTSTTFVACAQTTLVAGIPTTLAATAPGTLAATAPAAITDTPEPTTSPENQKLTFDEQVQLFLLFRSRKRNHHHEKILMQPPHFPSVYPTKSPLVLNGYYKTSEGTAVDKVIRPPFFLSRQPHEIRAYHQARQMSESFNHAVERAYNSKRRPPGI